MVNVIVYLIVLVLFLTFAVVLSRGKGAFLIAGYNTLSESEKAKYDEVALAKFIGKIMYGYCFSIMLWGLSELIHQQWLFTVGLVLFLGLTVFTLVYLNTGNRFKK